mgnify:CR=1 FL=1
MVVDLELFRWCEQVGRFGCLCKLSGGRPLRFELPVSGASLNPEVPFRGTQMGVTRWSEL